MCPPCSLALLLQVGTGMSTAHCFLALLVDVGGGMCMRSRRVNYTLKGQCDSRAATCGVRIMGDHGVPVTGFHVQETLVVTNCVAQK